MDQVQEVIFETHVDETREVDAPVKIDTVETPNIETKSILAEEAFQYFHGKIYSAGSGPRLEYSLADSVERRVESPWQRYTRLRAEVEELQGDVSAMIEDKARAEQGISVWSTLQTQTTVLLHSLEDMNAKLADMNEGAAPDRVAAALESLALAATPTPPAGTDPSTDSTPPAVSSSSRQAGSIAALERRVFALECLLGSASSSLDMEGVLGVPARGRCHSLVEGLARLDRRVVMLEETGLESVRTKTAQLRSELEEVQRDKIRTGGLAHKAIEAAQKIETLSNKVEEVQAIAEDLPTLLLRLKTLETLHREAATFNARLTALDDSATHLQAELHANTDVFTALQEGFAENMEVMRENVKQLDGRINDLLAST